MLNIVKSNKMEHLMGAFAAVVEKSPENPFVPEWVGVQSRGMKQWITSELAKKDGICANMQFWFPRQIVEMILDAWSPPDSGRPVLNEGYFLWSVLKHMEKSGTGSPNLKSVQAYIDQDPSGKKKVQLAMKVAKTFDDYLVYRPQMLMRWQKGLLSGSVKTDQEQWQSGLWQAVTGNSSVDHLPGKAMGFLKTGYRENWSKPLAVQRISFFGISSLPPVFLHVFNQAAQWLDIYYFILAPSSQFFFDSPARQPAKQAPLLIERPDDTQTLWDEDANPLLQSLGKSGGVFLSQMEDLAFYEPFGDLFEDPLESSSSMLAVLQSDILHHVKREPGNVLPPVTVEKEDCSISIHACHSPMREAQVLKDILLSEFEAQPDLSPHDIIVMMPDIEAYAPFIESVFTLENPLPFSISDRRKRSESEPVEAFLSILSLKGTRLEQQQVIDLLFFESVAAKFDMTTEDISKIEHMVNQANVLWGMDQEHRKTFGIKGYGENTWQFGLERLFMGMAMPGNHEFPVNGVLPCESFEGTELEVLGKFADFLETLFSCLHQMASAMDMGKWCEVLLNTTLQLQAKNNQNASDLTFLYQTIDELAKGSKASGDNLYLTFDMILPLLEKKLDARISQGNFMAGSITFCNIMPMRSIPFKIVVLMGMDEASFPRKTVDNGFNLLKRFPQKGDKDERGDDRYVFLETILSARSKLVITYTGMDIKDNSVLPPSGVVTELTDTIAHSFILPKEFACPVFHPLHAFDAGYFIQNPITGSFSQFHRIIADTLSKGSLKQETSLVQPEKPDTPKGVFQADLEDLIRFFRHPVKWYLKEKLNIRIPDPPAQVKDREPYSVMGLDQYVLGSWLLEKQNCRPGSEDGYAVLKAMGTLPPGQKGRLEYDRLHHLSEMIAERIGLHRDEELLEPVSMQTLIPPFSFFVHLTGIGTQAMYLTSFGRLTPARLLSGWIRHLFLNLCAPEGYPDKTILAGLDPKSSAKVLTIEFDGVRSKAQSFLQSLADLFFKGAESPLLFFCNTAFELAGYLEKKQFNVSWETVLSAMEKSRLSWYGSSWVKGENQEPYTQLYLCGNDPFGSIDQFMASGLADTAVTVFGPMLSHMRRLK